MDNLELLFISNWYDPTSKILLVDILQIPSCLEYTIPKQQGIRTTTTMNILFVGSYLRDKYGVGLEDRIQNILLKKLEDRKL